MNDDLNDIIKFDRESSQLDFKRVFYSNSKKEDLIKDLMSFANVLRSGSKYIIFGIDYKTNGERDIIGIDSPFPDTAMYHQLVNENIEPALHFDFFEYEVESKKLWVFKIFDNHNPPYLMRKDYRNLKKGDGFIRRGDSTDRLVREDFDKYSSLSPSVDFDKFLEIGFFNDHNCKIIEPEVLLNFRLPSAIEKERLQVLIDQKKKSENKRITKNDIQNADPKFKKILEANYLLQQIQITPRIPGFFDEEHLSIEELEKELDLVDKRFQKHDYYALFELNSQKIFLTIINKSQNYIEDASIKVLVENLDGLIISEEIFSEPSERSLIQNIGRYSLYYPSVKAKEQYYVIEEDIGEIKHHIPTNVFDSGLRIVFGEQTLEKEILFKIFLYGKNLPKPLERELTIKPTIPKRKNSAS